jgi:hypothetical protein
MRGVKSGIATPLLLSQVKATAGWLWDAPLPDERVRLVTNALDAVEAAEKDRKENGTAYLRALLSAHYATVATFVPTDVDTRIRHHTWALVESPDALGPMVDVVDEIASLDPRWVSARTVDDERGQALAGHQGEWFSVRAGALGRALALGATEIATRLVEAIDAELERHARVFDEAWKTNAPAERVLRLATILAHNLGDLSRVVEAWPGRPEMAEVRARYVRLGHPDAPSPMPAFVRAGALNKAIMALENHRFLALRKPRALRTSRALLLPIGPWFDAWGETIARSLEQRDVAEVVAALVETHLSSPEQQGILRALAGIHRATRGGIELYVPDLPARIRKDATRGKVREALDVTPEHFSAKMERRYKNERERLG